MADSKTQKRAAEPATPVDQFTVRQENEHRLWTTLVPEGAVIIQRVNALGSMGKLAGALALVAIAASVAMAFNGGISAGSAVKGWVVNQTEINRWAAGATLNAPSPAFVAATTKSDDYLRFVNQVEANPAALAPQASAAGKEGVIACVPMQSPAEPWSNPATQMPDRPRCKFVGDSIFIASFVQDSTSSRPLIYPVMGVFHKDGSTWRYYNFDGGMSTGIFALRDKPSVTIYQIANEVDKAFPGALSRGDITAPRTAWQKAKKTFEKFQNKN